MSLFGGDLPPQPPAEREESASPVPASLPPSDPDVPHGQTQVQQALPSSSEVSDTESESESRPNRYHGPARTWKHWTADERQTVASLEQIEAGDLAIHLYNAHALHRRVRSDKAARDAKPWHSKNRWIENKRDEDAWVPPKGWTAWPMEPDLVPRAYEKFGKVDDDYDDTYTFRRDDPDTQKPSQEMEDILMAIMLKNAKERWNKREWDDESAVDDEERPRKRGRAETQNLHVREESPTNASIASGKSKPHSGAVDSQEVSEGSAAHTMDSHLRTSSGASPPGHIKRSESEAPEQRDRKRPRSLHSNVGLRPVIMADDEKARTILQPIIRSTLSKFEYLLTSLHRSRQYDVDYEYDLAEASEKASATDAETESVTSGNETPQPAQGPSTPGKKKRGRPPQAAFSFDSSNFQETKPTDDDSTTTASKKVGRPKKFERLEGESYYLMHKRLKQAKTNKIGSGRAGHGHESTGVRTTTEEAPKTTETLPEDISKPPKRSRRRSSTGSSSSNESDASLYDRTNLRDWSAVLGHASLSGFSPAVIARTGKRCADLFGETMTFHMLHEEQALEMPRAPVEYRPDLAPSPSQMFDLRDDEDEVSEGTVEDDTHSRPYWDGETLDCPHADCKRHNRPYAQRHLLIEHIKRNHHYDPLADENEEDRPPRPHWDGESLFCPHEDCWGHTTVFAARWRLVDHVKRKHGYDPKAVERPEEDVLVGAVHNDGFMGPVTKKQGWKQYGAKDAKNEGAAHSGSD